MDVKKASFWSVIVFLCVLLISSGITGGIFLHRAIGQRDNRIRELEHQLTEQTDTIRRCRESVSDISRELREDITGLQAIIGKLRTIRDRVEDLERCLNNSGGDMSGGGDNSPHSEIGEL